MKALDLGAAEVLTKPRLDTPVARAEAVRDAVACAEAELAGQGRVLLRPSGTEQLVRVMVEAPTAEDAHGIAARIADVVAAAGS